MQQTVLPRALVLLQHQYNKRHFVLLVASFFDQKNKTSDEEALMTERSLGQHVPIETLQKAFIRAAWRLYSEPGARLQVRDVLNPEDLKSLQGRYRTYSARRRFRRMALSPENSFVDRAKMAFERLGKGPTSSMRR
jgi:hypothetical protein